MRTYTGTHRIYNLREICWSGVLVYNPGLTQ